MNKFKNVPFKSTELSSTTWQELQSGKRLREETAMDLDNEDQQQNVRRVKIDSTDQSTCDELWLARNDSSLIESTQNTSSTSSDVSEYYCAFNSESKWNSLLDSTLSNTSWTDCETESDRSTHSDHNGHIERDLNDIEQNLATIALECVRKNREQKADDKK